MVMAILMHLQPAWGWAALGPSIQSVASPREKLSAFYAGTTVCSVPLGDVMLAYAETPLAVGVVQLLSLYLLCFSSLRTRLCTKANDTSDASAWHL